jgi:adenosylcobinamide kinase/adenosylcobinamide-phosphate guanylyltransferase
MAHFTLITGGCRSGKSAYAQQLAESLPGRRAYVATCPVLDEEMRLRIERHQRARSRAQWETIEEPLNLAGALAGNPEYEVVLVDCVTLWVNNLMYLVERNGIQLRERDLTRHCEEVLEAGSKREGTVIFVTNEVGLGIVPDNALARRYRDLAGWCNQRIAAAADTVTLVTCGLPLHLKGHK